MEKTFVKFAKYEQILFKYAKGNLNVYGKEVHPFNEILLFLKGDATFLSEKYKVKLKTPSLIVIPRESFHQFILKNEEDYLRCVFNFPDLDNLKSEIDALFDEIKIIENVDSFSLLLIDNLRNQIKENEQNLPILLKSTLDLLILTLAKNEVVPSNTEPRQSGQLIARIIQQIGNCYLENPKLEDIAKSMYISVSNLTHIFKKEMGISVHRYINEKRLIHAHNLILSGVSPNIAAQSSGFRDYSTFVRAYKKMFDQSR